MSEEKDEQFQRLFERYYRSIVGFLIRLGIPRDQARDLAQDVFVRVYKAMDTWRGDAEWAFLATTARRLALNHIRGEHTQKRHGTNLPIDALNELAIEPAQESSFARRQQSEQLTAAVAELPEPLRIVVQLRLGGCSYTDIQRVAGVSLDTVKSRLHEARARLKKRLVGDDEEQ